MEITKDQLKIILQKAPQGSDPKKVIKALQAKGHTIEGLVSQEQFKAASPLVASVAEKISKAPAPTPQAAPSALPGRSTGVARPEELTEQLKGQKLPEIPEEEKGYFTKIKEGVGEGVQEAYKLEQEREALDFKGESLTGFSGAVDTAAREIPQTVIGKGIEIGLPLVKGIEAALDPVIETALDVPLPLAMQTQKEGFEYFVTPREYLEELKAGVPESVKEGAVQKLQEVNDWYKGLPPAYQTAIKDTGAITSIVATLFGGKAAKDVGKPLVKTGVQKVEDAGKAIVSKVENVKGSFEAKQIEKLKGQVDDIVGKIVQGDVKDIKSAKQALSEIDTVGVQSYKDLQGALNNKVQVLASKVDDILAKDTTTKPLDQFVNITQVGNRSVTTNYVDDAFNQLEELYTTTKEPTELARIQNLKDKAIAEGLTKKELNDLAREYGAAFKSKAFGKTGEPLTSVNAQAYENTRKGIKETLRGELPDKTVQFLDERMSNLIATRELVEKMVEKVNKLTQKIKERGWVEKLGRGVGVTLDKLTGGGVKGFVTSFIPSNVGNKVLNSIDLEKALNKNLTKIEKILKMEKLEQFEKAMKELNLSTQ